MAKEIKELFHSYGIHSTTIQLEYVDDGYFGCQVPCPAPAPGVELAESDSCIDSSCCRNRFSSEDNPAINVKTQF
ncbi:zinc transporter 1 [Eurytemora carolleeae]|uniref:zinc transporter 1 n=1 Tax=Eurytemora carolleeae TaxID=1294199 RepID=UPI000C770C38|nr:zinc transporter 1 [Eurytemora carolleeae]|eukprot:XP_023322852.1 zinc transporter 1-like [Eurytemora affinis]